MPRRHLLDDCDFATVQHVGDGKWKVLQYHPNKRKVMRQNYIRYVAGFIAGATLTGLASAELVLNAQDAVTRTQVQYADCKVVGDYPTAADMQPGDTGQ